MGRKFPRVAPGRGLPAESLEMRWCCSHENEPKTKMEAQTHLPHAKNLSSLRPVGRGGAVESEALPAP